MSGSASFYFLNEMLKQIHSLLEGTELSEKLFEPLRRAPSDASGYVAIATQALKYLPTLRLQQKYSDGLKAAAAFDRKINGSILSAGLALFLAGDFRLALQTLQDGKELIEPQLAYSQVLMGLCHLFLDQTGDAETLLNSASLTVELRVIVASAYYFSQSNFRRVLFALEAHSSEEKQKFLNLDPLILYFYAMAVYRLAVASGLERSGEYLERFDASLKPSLELRFKEPPRYFFLEKPLAELCELFGQRKLEWETWQAKEALAQKKRALAAQIDVLLIEVKQLGGIDQVPLSPESLEVIEQRRSLKRPPAISRIASIDEPGTGGSPSKFDESDDEVDDGSQSTKPAFDRHSPRGTPAVFDTSPRPAPLLTVPEAYAGY